MKRTAETSVTEVRLVEAAVQLFSRQGFKGTSTRDIAQLAGVNEATLFRYFGKKMDLFRAAAESRLNRLKFGRELQSGLARDLDPDVIVPMLAAFVVENMSEHPELMRLLYVARFELPGADQIFREHLGPIFDAVNAYFSRCAARGLIRDLDPTVATLGLAGAVGAHLNLHQLFTGRDVPWDAQNAAPIYAQLWLNALQQRPKRDQSL
ncbi:MAG: TetR/AcrR family transcriptional regulator [Candidatus Korobacteraceae bacterium]